MRPDLKAIAHAVQRGGNVELKAHRGGVVRDDPTLFLPFLPLDIQVRASTAFGQPITRAWTPVACVQG